MSIISVQSIAKRYYLRHVAQEQAALAMAVAKYIKNSVKSIIQANARRASKNALEEFWALDDVSFDIQPGERVGIIGKNGAGKSTLLKILSRITEPTKGRIIINGRVASLLEVGTGFNPELTGRENIFLNGAILGMNHAEIARKFDEIVSFAEVEKFLDTPVKHYSSGMYMRLAFAVAAHLEPEILIVDEVLAVGDAQFQNKCIGKMEDVGQSGRTILFVSHNMQAIRRLCERVICLRNGKVIFDGAVDQAIALYMEQGAGGRTVESNNVAISSLPPDPAFRLTGIDLRQNGGQVNLIVDNDHDLDIIFSYEVLERTSGLRVYFDLLDEQGSLIFRSFNDEDYDGIPVVNAGRYVSHAVIPRELLGPKRYVLQVGAGIHNVRQCIPDGLIAFDIDINHTSRYNRAYAADTFRGLLAPVLSWETKFYENQ